MMKPDSAASGTNHSYKKAVKVGDVIEINGEIDLFKVTKITSSGMITAREVMDGYMVEIPRCDIQFNHKDDFINL